MSRDEAFEFGGAVIYPGEFRDIDLPVSQTYSGDPVTLPVRVWRGRSPGPAVFVSGAVHGDEINGTGIVRSIILDHPFDLESGTLILVPVVNIFGFDRHARYLPDRRDLNRCFPGDPEGSQSSRLAHAIFTEIVSKADYGIDLHSAAVRRTNFPNVRADLRDPRVRTIAYAFGSELVVHGKGPSGSLRREACEAGCPTIILEAGEAWKIEPTVIEVGVRGIRNMLLELGMVEGTPRRPVYQVRIDRTKWVRANAGGMLQFHVAPGEVVEEGQALATNTSILGVEQDVIEAPVAGVVLGMTTLPSVTPGNPVCHLAVPRRGVASIRQALENASKKTLHERVRDDLATNVVVSEHANARAPASEGG